MKIKLMSDSNYTKILFRFYDENEEKYMVESCWASKHECGFKLENIPFYVKKFAYGDIVKTEVYDGMNEVKHLVHASGNSTVRIYVFEKKNLDKINDIIKKMGCGSEISRTEQLIAVDIPHNIPYRNIETYLKQGYEQDILDYEEACISENHNNLMSEE